MINNDRKKPLLYLRVTAGPHKGEVFPIANKAVIGRDKNCEISLSKDNKVSRQHAVIVFANNRFYIKNLSKNNKLLKNKKQIKESKVDFTDIIQVGNTKFRLVLKKALKMILQKIS